MLGFAEFGEIPITCVKVSKPALSSIAWDELPVRIAYPCHLGREGKGRERESSTYRAGLLLIICVTDVVTGYFLEHPLKHKW